MKNATQIADGFSREHRKRAHCLRERAYAEGFRAALAVIEGMLVPDLTDEEIVLAITVWLKEMKETGNE